MIFGSYCVSASPNPMKFAIFKCGGSLNLFLTSANLRPKYGASTVKTIAVKPELSALRTKFAVTYNFVFYNTIYIEQNSDA